MVAGKQSFVVQDIEVFAVTRSGLPYPSSSVSSSFGAKSASFEKKKAAAAISQVPFPSSATFGQPPAAKRKRGARGGRYAQDEEDDNSE
jgi:hypothetical protein